MLHLQAVLGKAALLVLAHEAVQHLDAGASNVHHVVTGACEDDGAGPAAAQIDALQHLEGATANGGVGVVEHLLGQDDRHLRCRVHQFWQALRRLTAHHDLFVGQSPRDQIPPLVPGTRHDAPKQACRFLPEVHGVLKQQAVHMDADHGRPGLAHHAEALPRRLGQTRVGGAQGVDQTVLDARGKDGRHPAQGIAGGGPNRIFRVVDQHAEVIEQLVRALLGHLRHRHQCSAADVRIVVHAGLDERLVSGVRMDAFGEDQTFDAVKAGEGTALAVKHHVEHVGPAGGQIEHLSRRQARPCAAAAFLDLRPLYNGGHLNRFAGARVAGDVIGHGLRPRTHATPHQHARPITAKG